jgi:hypothetical protein
MRNDLEKEFTLEEIKKVIFGANENKSSESDD